MTVFRTRIACPRTAALADALLGGLAVALLGGLPGCTPPAAPSPTAPAPTAPAAAGPAATRPAATDPAATGPAASPPAASAERALPAGAIAVGPDLYQVPIGTDAEGCQMYRLHSPGRMVTQAIAWRRPDGSFTRDRREAACAS